MVPIDAQKLWQQQGAVKLMSHAAQQPVSGLTHDHINQLANTPHGQSLLMRASSLKPGSAMMGSLVKRITAGDGRRLMATPVPEEGANLPALGWQQFNSLPPSVARIAYALNPNIVMGPARQNTQVGRGATASVVQGAGNNTIEINDPASFKQYASQTIGHELTHLWQNSLPPSIQAKIPNDPQDATAYDISDADKLRKAGNTLATIPREKAATIVQTYIAQPSQRKLLQPWIDDMNTIPMSSTLPTDPNATALNMTPRAPIPPAMAYAK